MNADEMSLRSVIDHAVKAGMMMPIPWCAEHDCPMIVGDETLPYCWDAFYILGDPAVETATCRLEEPQRAYRIKP